MKWNCKRLTLRFSDEEVEEIEKAKNAYEKIVCLDLSYSKFVKMIIKKSLENKKK